jgi:hypothetical protein
VGSSGCTATKELSRISRRHFPDWYESLKKLYAANTSPDKISQHIDEFVKTSSHSFRFSYNEIRHPFLRKDRLPKEGVFIDKNLNMHVIIDVKYRLLRKERTVRYGRDESYDLTSPAPEFIGEEFKMHPIIGEFQVDFLDDIFKRIHQRVKFSGKKAFFDEYHDLVQTFRKTEDCSSDDNKVSDSLLHSVRALYNGIAQLTSKSEIKDRIVIGLLQEQPEVLEAFYDYENLQKTMWIRDHFWRGNVGGKTRFLKRFGYPYSLRDSGYADEFYEALSWVDMYHRGFPKKEDHIIDITRGNTRCSYSELESSSSIGLLPSGKVNELLEHITQYTNRLSENIQKGSATGFLTMPEQEK